MRKQQHLTNDMRSILIQWLIDVSIEYGLVEETVFLAVHYIDRFLSVMSVVRDKFQLLGAAAIMISVKVEDVIKIPPEDWSMLTANAYTTRQIIRMEQFIMNVLKFDLRPPTVICFIRHICARYDFTKDTLLLSTYVAELTLLDGNKYIEYLPSKLAVSAIVLVRHVLNESEPYFENLQFCCGYSCEEIKSVMIQMYCTLCEACGGKFQSIERKYGDKVSEFLATINRNNMNFFA
ncbi:hypothetical protein RI129_009597 [Pyrocoelia pectoralis]|uniref:Cyclin A n=1 Tax=Pyrocoelia pectoralis TaxID=417401 RepID=A0AAN7V2I5_9COLE